MSEHLRVNPILCDAYGHCAELLPELIQPDEWGYPIIDDAAIPQELVHGARRAVSSCPRLALFIEQRADDARALRPVGAEGTSRTGVERAVTRRDPPKKLDWKEDGVDGRRRLIEKAR